MLNLTWDEKLVLHLRTNPEINLVSGDFREANGRTGKFYGDGGSTCTLHGCWKEKSKKNQLRDKKNH